MKAPSVLGLDRIPRVLWLAVPAAVMAGLLYLGGFAKTVALGAGAVGGVAFLFLCLSTPVVPLITLAGLVQQGGWISAFLGSRVFSYSDVLILLTIAGMIVRRKLSDPRRRVPEDLAVRIMLLLVGWMGLSLVGSSEMRDGLIETQKFFGYLVLLVITQIAAVDKRHIRFLILALVLGSALSAGVIASDQYLGTRLGRIGQSRSVTHDRLSGTHDNPAEGAQMMAAGAAMAIILLVRDRRRRWLTAGAIALTLVGIPATGTRAAVLVLGIAGVWLAFKFRRHRRFGAVVLITPILATIVISALPGYVLDRFVALRDPTQDSPSTIRLAMFSVGLDMIQEHPIMGVGPGQFTQTWNSFEYRWVSGGNRRFPMHNSLLAFAVDDGLVGLALFVAFLFVVFRGLRWTQRHAADPDHRILAETMEFGLALYFVCTLTGPGARSLFFWFLPAISLALVRIARLDTLDKARPAREGLGLPVGDLHSWPTVEPEESSPLPR